jgi:error-prone DNA polymerase
MVLGFSLDRHLVEHYRRRLDALRVVPSGELAHRPEGKLVAVGGLVVCRQKPPTAKGHMFLTLEDEGGLVNVIVRPRVYARYRDALRNHPLIAVAGRVQHGRGTVNVLAERAVALDLGVADADPAGEDAATVGRAPVASHDFH